MKENTEITETTENTTRDFFAEDEVEVSITKKGHTTVWYMREVFTDEMDELDKAFAGKTAEQRKELNARHQAKMLTLTCTRPPKNPLPGFPPLDSVNFRTAIYEYLTSYANKVEEKKKQAYVSELTTLYSRKTAAEEFFRSI